MKDLYENSKKYSNHRRIQRSRDEYVIISLNMVEVDNRDKVVFKLKDLKKGIYLFKTAQEIIHKPQIALGLGKRDLMQVCYLAGFEQNSVHSS